MANCELCGEPMSVGEEMFKYHGYSGDCPKPPLAKTSVLRESWKDEVLDLRQRITSWVFSSGGSAMYNDDKDPHHLLFLVARALMENDGWTIPPDQCTRCGCAITNDDYDDYEHGPGLCTKGKFTFR